MLRGGGVRTRNPKKARVLDRAAIGMDSFVGIHK